MDETEARLERIEVKLAYLEDFLDRLQAEVVERNTLLDRLAAEQGAVREKITAMAQELEEIPDRRPPHY